MVIKNKSLLYSLVTLVVSWGFTFLLFQNPDKAIQSFALVMFIPMIIAFIFQRIPALKRRESIPFVSKRLLGKSITFAILYPLIMIVLVTIVDVVFGVSHVKKGELGDLPTLIKTIVLILPAMLSAFGEEYGWRGYLLPTLTESFSKLKASILTGIVWMLFHVPVVFLLARLEGLAHPSVVMMIQAADVFVFSFAFAYLFFMSKQVFPVVLLHAVWNVFNPYVLGDLYTNTPGIMEGNLLIQNGEGVMGLLLAAILAIYFMVRLKGKKDGEPVPIKGATTPI